MRYHLFTCILFLLSLVVYGQDKVQKTQISIDTSEYIQDDIDFNLLIASFNAYDSEVLRLLNNGANINSTSDEGLTPLMYAVSGGHLTTVKILTLNGAKVNFKSYDGSSPIITAGKNGFTDIAEELIRAGASPNDRDASGVTPLMYAAAYNYFILCDLLLYYGADPNLSDRKLSTPLMAAIYAGNFGIIKNLLENAADPDKPDKKGTTPIMLAAQTGDTLILKLLLSNGANISTRDNAGYNAVYYAAFNGHTEILDQIWYIGDQKEQELVKNPLPYMTPLLKKKKELKEWMKVHEIKSKYKPSFTSLPMGSDLIFAKDDFFLGFLLGITEQYTGITSAFSYQFRISEKRVLVPYDDNELYQFWEKLNILSFSLGKSLPLLLINQRLKAGIFGKLSGNYSFGPAYSGSLTKPENSFKISPEVGIYGERKNFIFQISYAWYDLGYIDGSPHQIRFGFYYKLNLRKNIFSNKVIKWY
ncbi:MAG: hypothetical protein DRI73_01400 [Bacteroidetes bacterium]|nr:MAG: hypothetical protein DRI73_01400 [Bacteroidota bacterium]